MTAKPEGSDQTLDELRRENDELRAVLGELRQRLREPEDIIRALRHGEVDALVVTEPRGERIYSLRSADVLYRGMIENMKEGALVLDRGGVVVYCNAYFAELIEIDRAAILGTSILPRIPEESRPFFSNLQQPGRREGAEERLRGEIVLRSQSGELVPLFATTNRLEVDEHDLICVILTDLRGQKREQELLEQSRRKDEFLAMLAHELRNPLAPIRNAASLLTVAAPNEARLQRARGVIDRQVNHLTRLIDDLLDVSRITRGKIRLERRTDRSGSGHLAQRRDRSAARRGASAPFLRRAAVRAAVRQRGPDPVVAGPGQPAEQRRQVHARTAAQSRWPRAARGRWSR